MYVMFRCFVVLFLFFIGLDAFAQSASDCAAMQDATERLACYDKLFESSGQPARQSSTRTPTTIEDLGLPSTQSSAAGEPERPKAEDDFGLEQAERARPEPPRTIGEIQSRVKALRRKDRQEVIFLLDNGQIWIQDVFRFMTVEQGDAVTIKRARMGGYIMTTERGASTRVQRIR